jgi:hypothetical protein
VIEHVVMQTERSDTACASDTQMALPNSALDQIANSTSADEVTKR